MAPLNIPVYVLGSSTAGRKPGDGTLRALGQRELCINTTDQILYYLNAAGTLIAMPINPTIFAMLASPALTGTPTAPTAAAGTKTAQIATTAFVAAIVATLFNRTPVASGAYQILATDRMVAYTGLAASSTATLPAASAFPVGYPLTVYDEGGKATSSIVLTVAAAGTDKVNGAASAAISTAYGYLTLVSNGSNAWIVVDSPSGVAFPISIANGGTGQTTAAAALSALLGAPLASPTFTGTPAAPTAAAGTNTTQLATTAFVAAVKALLAPLASPTFTGTPAAPTPASGTNTTQLATAAFVFGTLSAGSNGYVKLSNGLIIQWGVAGGSSSGNNGTSFNVGFPNASYSVLATSTGNLSTTTANACVVAVQSHDTGGFQWTSRYYNGGFQADNNSVNWIAIGY